MRTYRAAEVVNSFLLGALLGVALLASVRSNLQRERDAWKPRAAPAAISLDADAGLMSCVAVEINRRSF